MRPTPQHDPQPQPQKGEQGKGQRKEAAVSASGCRTPGACPPDAALVRSRRTRDIAERACLPARPPARRHPRQGRTGQGRAGARRALRCQSAALFRPRRAAACAPQATHTAARQAPADAAARALCLVRRGARACVPCCALTCAPAPGALERARGHRRGQPQLWQLGARPPASQPRHRGQGRAREQGRRRGRRHRSLAAGDRRHRHAGTGTGTAPRRARTPQQGSALLSLLRSAFQSLALLCFALKGLLCFALLLCEALPVLLCLLLLLCFAFPLIFAPACSVACCPPQAPPGHWVAQSRTHARA